MKKDYVWVALIACVGTLVAVLLFLNLNGGEERIEKSVGRLYSTDDAQFRRSLSALLGPQILDGNQVDVLLNGDQIFPAMLRDIRGAERTITFETFIYWSESIGQEFADSLAERANAGVKVHVLLDWIGSSKMESSSIEKMKRAGVQIVRYHEPHWSNLARLNNRTHRKLLIVDGRFGFTGGVGIADQWRGNAQDVRHWRDTHFRVTGPVVAQMQAVFADNWTKATGDVLHGEHYFPALSPTGTQPAQMFSSSPTGGSESMHLMYLIAIAAAERSIQLSSAYFVPDELAIQALADAAKRGVNVQVITPGANIDTDVVRRASRARWGPLLDAGVKIAEYEPTMFHCKVLVVDDRFVSIGSTNFDNRSFRLNDEANLNVLDQQFALQQVQIFEDDLKKSKQITIEAWKSRPAREKVMEKLASLLGSQL